MIRGSFFWPRLADYLRLRQSFLQLGGAGLAHLGFMEIQHLQVGKLLEVRQGRVADLGGGKVQFACAALYFFEMP